MAGRKLSRTNQGHIDTAIARLMAAGGRAPGPDTSPIGKADSLGDQIEAVARAVYAMSDDPMSGVCVEDVFADRVIIEIGEDYYRAAYSVAADGSVTIAPRAAWRRVVEEWVDAPDTPAAKAGALLGEAEQTHYATLKAVGNRRIEVTVAYGGHKNGKDSHDEYFSPRTDFGEEDFPAPPLLYYHGFDEHGKRMGKPVVTGKFISRRRDSVGAHFTYDLKNNKYADLQWGAAQEGRCVASPGTIGHLIRKSPDGHLDYWALAEISAWDYDGKRAPANFHSVAVPTLKALYLSEGLTLPTSLETTPPEAPGDGASAGEAITTDQARQIVLSLTTDLLHTYRKETSR